MEVISLLKSAEIDFKWFKENFKEIKIKFAGEYIAIKEMDIKFHNKNYYELLEKIKKETQNPFDFLIKKIPSLKEVLIYNV
jgi:hypothetical protein